MTEAVPRQVRLPRVALAALLGGYAGLAFAPVFGGVPGPPRFVTAIVAAAGIAAAVALVAALAPRMPATGTALAGVVGVAAAVMVVVRPGAAVADGPRQLLTGALPADAAGPGLAAVAFLIGWTTLAAGLLAWHASGPLPAMIPPAVCLVAALALGASAHPLPDWYAPAGLVIAVALLATGNIGTPGGRRRSIVATTRLAGVVVIGGVAVLSAATLGGVVPGSGGRPPADVRALVSAPVEPRTGTSPLQQYLVLRDEKTPFKLTGKVSSPGVPLLRMVTLTHFDGIIWTVAGDYRRAGTSLPAPDDGGADGGPDGLHTTTVTQDVRVEAGDLAWLPTAGRTTRISVPELGVDEATGDIINPLSRPDLTAYTATSLRYKPPRSLIEAAQPSRRQDAGGVPIPPKVRAFVDETVRDHPPGTAQVLALLDRFATSKEFRYDQAKEVEGGHGLYQIQDLLERERLRGTSEQYASAFAVMTRHLGYDARVVMGFRPEYKGSSFVVQGRNVYAWVEVRFDGLGWVGLDPSPWSNPIGSRPDVPAPAIQDDSTEKPGDASDPPASADAGSGTPPSGAADSSGDRGPADGRVLWIALALCFAVLVVAGAVPVAKAVRTHRRRHARSVRRAVIGAWRETVDRLREAGVPASPALTTGEVLASVSARDSRVPMPPALPALAAMVDRAGYAPEEPAPSAAADAWQAAAAVRRQLHTGVRPLRRVGALLDPRPLRSSVRLSQVRGMNADGSLRRRRKTVRTKDLSMHR